MTNDKKGTRNTIAMAVLVTSITTGLIYIIVAWVKNSNIAEAVEIAIVGLILAFLIYVILKVTIKADKTI